MPVNDADRRKLRVLWVGAGLYFLIFLNGLRYFSQLPYQIVILGAALNAAIFTAIIVSLRKVYKRIGSEAQNAVPSVPPIGTTHAKPRNIRALWVAACLYFFAMLIAVQYATKLPYQLLVLSAVLNMAIVLTFVVKLRKAYMDTGRRNGT
jgi:hypothetical protein